MVRPIWTALSIALLATTAESKNILWKVHFREWFPQYDQVWTNLTTYNCSQQYENYKHLDPPRNQINKYAAAMVKCLLGGAGEDLKANMIGAAVVLGLLPTLLGLVGSNTTETGILTQFRPILSILLTIGAPIVNPLRTFENPIDPLELLKRRPKSRPFFGEETLRMSALISATEYIAAFCAAVLTAYTTYQMWIRTITAFAPDNEWLPWLWLSLALLVHAAGAYAMKQRVKVSWRKGLTTPNTKSKLGRLRIFFKREGTLCITAPAEGISLKTETKRYILMSWALPTGTVLYIIFGTMLFSSALFISTQDAVMVCSRYLAATMLCRVIVMYELSGLRATIKLEDYEVVEPAPHKIWPSVVTDADTEAYPLAPYRTISPSFETA